MSVWITMYDSRCNLLSLREIIKESHPYKIRYSNKFFHLESVLFSTNPDVILLCLRIGISQGQREQLCHMKCYLLDCMSIVFKFDEFFVALLYH